MPAYNAVQRVGRIPGGGGDFASTVVLLGELRKEKVLGKGEG